MSETPADQRARELAEYLETGGPHGGVPATVATDSDLWREVIATLKAVVALVDERTEQLRLANIDASNEMARVAYLQDALNPVADARDAAEQRCAAILTLLRALEWVDDAPWIRPPDKTTFRWCPTCRATERDGHKPKCALAVLASPVPGGQHE